MGFDEDELFTLAGYLSPQSVDKAETYRGYPAGQIDPHVARVLAQEPADVQRAVIAILTILKNIAQGMTPK